MNKDTIYIVVESGTVTEVYSNSDTKHNVVILDYDDDFTSEDNLEDLYCMIIALKLKPIYVR